MLKTLIASALLVSNVGVDWLTSKFDTYDKIQKQVYEYAEPGYMEYKSADLFIKHLEENGFKVGNARLKEFFGVVIPDYDRERVHDSDIKKAISWFNMLVAAGMTKFELPEE